MIFFYIFILFLSIYEINNIIKNNSNNKKCLIIIYISMTIVVVIIFINYQINRYDKSLAYYILNFFNISY